MSGHWEKVRASPRGRAKVWAVALAGEKEAKTSAILSLLFIWFWFFPSLWGLQQAFDRTVVNWRRKKKNSNPPSSTSEPFAVKIFDLSGLV